MELMTLLYLGGGVAVVGVVGYAVHRYREKYGGGGFGGGVGGKGFGIEPGKRGDEWDEPAIAAGKKTWKLFKKATAKTDDAGEAAEEGNLDKFKRTVDGMVGDTEHAVKNLKRYANKEAILEEKTAREEKKGAEAEEVEEVSGEILEGKE